MKVFSEEYIKKTFKTHKKKPVSKETRKKMSKNNSRYWKDKKFTKEHRQKISESHKGKHPTEKTRKKMSKSKKGKNHPLYGKSRPEQFRKKLSKANKGKILSEDTKRKIGEASKGEKHWNWKGGPVKILCKLCGKERFANPCEIKKGFGKFCSCRCSIIYNRIHSQKTKDTDIELLVKGELIKRNIPFEPQFPILNFTVVDFFIPPNIVIYCDGDYWHSTKKRREKDKKQNSRLTSNGYKVFRFTGTEIKESVGNCVGEISKYLGGNL